MLLQVLDRMVDMTVIEVSHLFVEDCTVCRIHIHSELKQFSVTKTCHIILWPIVMEVMLGWIAFAP